MFVIFCGLRQQKKKPKTRENENRKWNEFLTLSLVFHRSVSFFCFVLLRGGISSQSRLRFIWHFFFLFRLEKNDKKHVAILSSNNVSHWCYHHHHLHTTSPPYFYCQILWKKWWYKHIIYLSIYLYEFLGYLYNTHESNQFHIMTYHNHHDHHQWWKKDDFDENSSNKLYICFDELLLFGWIRKNFQ